MPRPFPAFLARRLIYSQTRRIMNCVPGGRGETRLWSKRYYLPSLFRLLSFYIFYDVMLTSILPLLCSHRSMNFRGSSSRKHSNSQSFVRQLNMVSYQYSLLFFVSLCAIRQWATTTSSSSSTRKRGRDAGTTGADAASPPAKKATTAAITKKQSPKKPAAKGKGVAGKKKQQYVSYLYQYLLVLSLLVFCFIFTIVFLLLILYIYSTSCPYL